MTARKKAAPPAPPSWRSAFPLIVLCLLMASLLIVAITDPGPELGSDPASSVWLDLAVSLALGALSLAVALSVPPRTDETIRRALLRSALVAFVALPTVGLVLEQIVGFYDFHGRPTTVTEQELPLRKASMRHSKNDYYPVSLRDYPASVYLNERDYVRAFRTARRADATGYCVRVSIERSDRAARLLAPTAVALPVGSLRRCRR